LSFFTVQRVFNAYTVGIPVWFYRWDIRDKSVKEHGYFGVYHPHSVFNHYPTKFVAGDDGGISDAVFETSKMAGFRGTRKQQRVTAIEFDTGERSNSEEIEGVMDEFEFSAGQLVQDLEEQARKAAARIRR
jgi:hypothetical protein